MKMEPSDMVYKSKKHIQKNQLFAFLFPEANLFLLFARQAVTQ